MQEGLGACAAPRVHSLGGEPGGVALELGAHLCDVHDVVGIDGGDEGATPRLHGHQVLQRQPLDRFAQRRASDPHLVHELVLAQDRAGREA